MSETDDFVARIREKDEPNPHIKHRGDLYDPVKSDERIVEATGKPIEEIREGFKNVFEIFKRRVELNSQYLNIDLLRLVRELQEENEQLKREISELRTAIASNPKV